MKQQRLNLGLVVILLLSCLGFSMRAADPPVPAPAMYYPSARPESPMIFNPGTKGYIYFQTGSQIVYAKANVIQGGAVLGSVTYNGQTPANNVVSVNSTNEPAFQQVKGGLFTVSVYEVKYIVDGAEYVYSNTDAPLGSVDYMRSPDDGKVVSIKHLGNNTMLSYYDADDPSDGVIVYTFDKAVLPDELCAYLEYGESTQYFIYDVPYTLSEDGLTLTIDLRGVSRGKENYLAPGVTFVDEFGQPMPPPTNISINVTGVNCADGSRIAAEAHSLDGQYSSMLRGTLYQAYDYIDLTFDNPAIAGVEFYSSANPAQRYGAINADTDMMDILMVNLEYIASTDVLLSAGSATARVANADIKKGTSALTLKLPANIKAAGSEGLVVELDNVTFTAFDGADHVIKPYGTSSATPEVLTLADLKKIEPNHKVIINAVDGVKVTMSNDMGYTFIEDNTAGIMVMTPDYSKALTESTLVKGRLVGTYMGYGTLMLDKNASAYVDSDIDVSTGAVIKTLQEIASGEYDNRLVTIAASDAIPIAIEGGVLMVGGIIPVVTDFIQPYDLPETVSSVTGIVYRDGQQPLLLVRYAKDIETAVSGIGTISVATAADAPVYDLRGVKVAESGASLKGLAPGVYIIGNKKTVIK